MNRVKYKLDKELKFSFNLEKIYQKIFDHFTINEYPIVNEKLFTMKLFWIANFSHSRISQNNIIRVRKVILGCKNWVVADFMNWQLMLVPVTNLLKRLVMKNVKKDDRRMVRWNARNEKFSLQKVFSVLWFDYHFRVAVWRFSRDRNF